ncbi:hypothetical protein PIROE2DRAFT_15732 [Piromyces sp. E2]|nr:hypothetical protein PIROE2DRAFT_15732 [Piromyces sp. E2]|eukprot:OUM58905.1 hypothetical protein PIROE2DRAFT_15732 [Piromyces sp. E2]
MCFLPIYFIILIFNIIITGYAKVLNVNNVSELKNALQFQSDNIVIINIKNEIIVDDSDFLIVGDSISKIIIKGRSTNNSKIIFNSKKSGIFFGKNVSDVEITDIFLESEGSVLYFDNNQNINIYNAHITGFTEANMDSISKNVFTITDSFFSTPKSPINYLLKAFLSNLVIDNSRFYGTDNLLISCLYITNKDNSEAYVSNEDNRNAFGTVEISNSLFDGGYTSRGIIGYFISDINIRNSEIKDCYNNVR